MITKYFNYLIITSAIVISPCIASDQIADPTMPANYKNNSSLNSSQELTAAIPYEWVLNSTLISPYQKIAIINGKQLKVGEEINQAIIKYITHQQVTLSYQEKIITLSLQKSFISQIKDSQL